MLDQWISRDYAVPKWRGHTGDRVELTANGLRQGCTLSPNMYLVVINILVSKEPNVSMSDWDKGYRKYAFSSVGTDSEACRSRGMDVVSIM